MELESLPKNVAREVERILAQSPGMGLEQAVGEALRRNPRLIRDWRQWEAAGRPSQVEQALKDQLGALDKLRSDAIIVGAQLEELHRRAERVYPPPPRDSVPKRAETRSRPLPVRKAADEDWRARTLEGVIADLYALADALPPDLSRRLVSVLNELNAIAEELGGEKSRRRLKAMAAA